MHIGDFNPFGNKKKLEGFYKVLKVGVWDQIWQNFWQFEAFASKYPYLVTHKWWNVT